MAVAPRNYRRHPARRVGEVGICWDGSAEARLALRTAVELAEMAEAELCVCTAVDSRGFLHPNYPRDYVPEVGGLMEAAQAVAAEALEQVPGHMPASLYVLVDDPAGVIADRAGRKASTSWSRARAAMDRYGGFCWEACPTGSRAWRPARC